MMLPSLLMFTCNKNIKRWKDGLKPQYSKLYYNLVLIIKRILYIEPILKTSITLHNKVFNVDIKVPMSYVAPL